MLEELFAPRRDEALYQLIAWVALRVAPLTDTDREELQAMITRSEKREQIAHEDDAEARRFVACALLVDIQRRLSRAPLVSLQGGRDG